MNWKRITIISLSIFLGFYLLLAATVFNKSDKLNVPCKEFMSLLRKTSSRVS